jgi:hypothetical protein
MKYTKEKMIEAVRLVREDGDSTASTAEASGNPRMTLSNRWRIPS